MQATAYRNFNHKGIILHQKAGNMILPSMLLEDIHLHQEQTISLEDALLFDYESRSDNYSLLVDQLM